MNPSGDVTGLLTAWKDGNSEALDELIPIVYTELRRLARQQLGGERRNHSLQQVRVDFTDYIVVSALNRDGFQKRFAKSF